jgi:hypothetical protein
VSDHVHDSADESLPGPVPSDDEPGGESTPLDTRGDGPVGLEDRTGTDEKSAPATNQGKAEPIPPTPGHRDPTAPLEPPLLEDMNVGAADPQRPSLAGSAPTEGTRPAGAAPAAAGGPGAAPPAASHRAPGLQGSASPAERLETDVDSSAAEMVRDTGRDAGTGDPQGVPVPSTTPSSGTSEEHGAVQGARLPDEGR